MKEERLAILRMLENGTISVDEAERLLNAVKETGDKMDFSESLNTFFSKTGDVLEKAGQKVKSAAKTAGEKAEVAKPEIIKAAKVVKEKVGETADSIMEDIKRRRAESGDGDVFEGERQTSPKIRKANRKNRRKAPLTRPCMPRISMRNFERQSSTK